MAVAAVPRQVQQLTEMPVAVQPVAQRLQEEVTVEMVLLPMELQALPVTFPVVAVVVPEEVTMVEL